MIAILMLTWLAGSAAVLVACRAARRRRAQLARELHELRGALTSARLAVDLLPMLDLDRPSVSRAASDELARSYQSLGEFEQLLHAKLMPRPLVIGGDGYGPAGMIGRRPRIDAHEQLGRLALIWGEAARRNGREFHYEWHGPRTCVFIAGPQRRFVEVVANLLANAVRHGGGRIEVVARVRSDSLRIEVRDQGPGLNRPVAALARRGRGPHGHGLTVALRAARKLGGALHSAPSATGATMVFTLPAIHDPATASLVGIGERAEEKDG